ncbi:MAG: efflux RND transporter periplasmic adaptor subunit [Verrucomicrobia bacterium]|nr:efflux RND transporter periplasmic adaptor subunit [Verrucomicrobiota bacterium]MCG2681974.1 efflux RND transporter periplasmic adaptor subunit [Kiritimatiellia bacterium]MBU4248450.1 efflux RND transporter periplasmic adaptor subunit [Verrucomicrobiota bacterium]MBU4292352.1 efflux RND transporter periplasmic adaptor subunit [Verrucomicrobiota bacterium]MBU4430019.1 efflux RND transporter periplasmic adaptor subunit [Verrucomicrobiota bacterium]
MKATRFLLLGLAAGLLAGCGFRRDMPDGSGTIECVQVQVAPLVGGRLLTFSPREGAVLKKGDLIARLDPVDYELKRNEARATLAAAQAQLDLMLAGSRDEDIRRSQDQVREAEAAARAADADLQRIKNVYEKKSATQKQMDDTQAAADRTAAARSATEQTLAKVLRGNRDEEIRSAQGLMDAAQARLAQMEKAIADCLVTAPQDGVVTTRVREDGEVVAAGAVLLILSRLNEVWLSLYIPESRLGQVKLGQPAWIGIDGDSRRFEGKVTFVSPEAEFTPRNVQTPEERAKLVYRIKITLPNPDGIFKPGMPADGYLENAR